MMNRTERRKHDADTRKLMHRIRQDHHATRKSGKWRYWAQKAVAPGEIGGNGWTLEIHTAYENGIYSVLVRTIETAWGRCDHACISSLVDGDIPWRDKQRIKSELFGDEATALEVFPAESDLIDGADSYHLWVFDANFRVPFGIGRRADGL